MSFAAPARRACEIGKEIGIDWAKTLGAKLMALTLDDLDLLKQLRGAGASGRNVRELNIRRHGPLRRPVRSPYRANLCIR
jgi:hypothetical protein